MDEQLKIKSSYRKLKFNEKIKNPEPVRGMLSSKRVFYSLNTLLCLQA